MAGYCGRSSYGRGVLGFETKIFGFGSRRLSIDKIDTMLIKDKDLDMLLLGCAKCLGCLDTTERRVVPD